MLIGAKGLYEGHKVAYLNKNLSSEYTLFAYIAQIYIGTQHKLPFNICMREYMKW